MVSVSIEEVSMKKPILIGISGGTGSGKTSIAKKIFESFNSDEIAIIMQDSYYKDQSSLSMEMREKTNYDHPGAFDTDLLVTQLDSLLKGKSVEKPVYDFKVHTRSNETEIVEPRPIILVEGILIFYDERLRNMFDIKIFVDTDADIRILRRIKRDISERGRTVESVMEQYLNIVRPMHIQYTEPTKSFADIIIPEGGKNLVAIDVVVKFIREHMNNN